MVYKYIGTIPSDANEEYRVAAEDGDDASSSSDGVGAAVGAVPTLPLPGRFVELELPDSDPRAVAYVSGSAPNAWGYLADGRTVSEIILEKDKRASEYDVSRRKH